MTIPAFIGRQPELTTLQRFLKKKTASFLVVKGRRRIGKSRLVEEFAVPYAFYSLSGIPPTSKTTAQSQRNEFASQLEKYGFPNVTASDWNALFLLLAGKTQKGRVIVLLDEISWMGSLDPDFLGKLKNNWDTEFKKNPQLILIVCGSASSWIEKNILQSTGFVGRVSLTLTIDELPLKSCQPFWGKKSGNISAMEKLKMLSVTGGVPRYLEEINPALSAEDNIKNLCFTKGALLAEEFERIFSSVFLRKSDYYKKIVCVLSERSKEFSEVCDALNVEQSGRILEYLDELALSGFVKRDYTWQIKSGRDAKLSRYRLSDNYVRFYLKYIEKYKTKIERNSFDIKSLSTLPGWETIIALQYENLVLNNRQYLWHILGIKPENIISENPFFQHKTEKQAGCQIDYMVQTKMGTLYICEIKFSKNRVGYKVVEEMMHKIKTLNYPKGFSCRPVLIHVNGVHENVIECDYFSHIIDFGKALDGETI